MISLDIASLEPGLLLRHHQRQLPRPDSGLVIQEMGPLQWQNVGQKKQSLQQMERWGSSALLAGSCGQVNQGPACKAGRISEQASASSTCGEGAHPRPGSPALLHAQKHPVNESPSAQGTLQLLAIKNLPAVSGN